MQAAPGSNRLEPASGGVAGRSGQGSCFPFTAVSWPSFVPPSMFQCEDEHYMVKWPVIFLDKRVFLEEESRRQLKLKESFFFKASFACHLQIPFTRSCFHFPT
jgi:hypothetical protein